MGRMIVGWKSEGDTDTGEEIGKVYIYYGDEPDVDPLDEWMTVVAGGVVNTTGAGDTGTVHDLADPLTGPPVALSGSG